MYLFICKYVICMRCNCLVLTHSVFSTLFIIIILACIVISRSAYCIVPNVDINLQSGRFWATSIAPFKEKLLDFRSCWIVFIHIVRGHPGGRLQFSSPRGKLLRSSWLSSGICTVWPNREKCLCLDNSCKVWLLGCPSHIIVLPFDSLKTFAHSR